MVHSADRPAGGARPEVLGSPASSVTPAELDAMDRALELARRGPAHGPNPRVGCVLLSSAGAVLAEGWHDGAGPPRRLSPPRAASPRRRASPQRARRPHCSAARPPPVGSARVRAPAGPAPGHGPSRPARPASPRTPAELDAMGRALELARRGTAHGPNPRVGCVLLSSCLLYTSPSPRDGLLSRMP